MHMRMLEQCIASCIYLIVCVIALLWQISELKGDGLSCAIKTDVLLFR